MATRKSIAYLPPVSLDLSRTRSNQYALSEIPRILAGNAAWLAGYVVGGEELEDGTTPNPAPRSPMHGMRGHTHSGGIDGRALFRSIYSASFGPSDVYSSNISENGHITVTTWPQRSTASASDERTYPVGPLLPIWVPGCDLRSGAYRALAWRAVVRVVSANNPQVGDIITLRIRNLTTEAEVSDALTTGAPTAATEYYVSDNAGADLLPMDVGGLNVLQLSATYTEDGTSAIRGCTIELLELELGVYES